MIKNHPYSQQFMALFEGFQGAYGVYSTGEKKKGKAKVGGKAASLVGQPHAGIWSDHLNGKQGLGIIPINEKGQCRFGAIDVDRYDIDPASVYNKVSKMGLPLVVCRSKSGGCHLFCFTTDFVSADIMKSKLAEFASVLGYGGSEIFPKQTELLVERGDAGSWINIPYFKGEETDRYAYGENAMPIKSIQEFLREAQRKMIDPEMLETYSVGRKDPLGPDAPPCLNCLCSQGFPEGTRNNGLMQLGIFAILKDKDNWERELDKMNAEYMDPPLSSVEVLGVIKSLKKKEYRYMCSSQPMASFCNRPKCRTVRYGIGPSTGMPTMGTLTKFATTPPVWFLDIEGGGRIELTTEDLQQPLRFQKACMDQHNIMPPVLKRDNWSDIVAALLESVNIVSVPYESTPTGQLMSYLEDFFNVKSHPKEKRGREVLLTGNVWKEYDDTYHFRLRDFMDYLAVRRFTEFKQSKVAVMLKEMGAKHSFINIKGKGCNTYTIVVKNATQSEPFDHAKNIHQSPI